MLLTPNTAVNGTSDALHACPTAKASRFSASHPVVGWTLAAIVSSVVWASVHAIGEVNTRDTPDASPAARSALQSTRVCIGPGNSLLPALTAWLTSVTRAATSTSCGRYWVRFG